MFDGESGTDRFTLAAAMVEHRVPVGNSECL